MRKQKVYAGVEYDEDGNPIPTASKFHLNNIFSKRVNKLKVFVLLIIVGRYCEWKHRTIDRSEEIDSFEEYMKTLELDCEEGEPGYLNWTVPMDTPELLYYQVIIKIYSNFY